MKVFHVSACVCVCVIVTGMVIKVRVLFKVFFLGMTRERPASSGPVELQCLRVRGHRASLVLQDQTHTVHLVEPREAQTENLHSLQMTEGRDICTVINRGQRR